MQQIKQELADLFALIKRHFKRHLMRSKGSPMKHPLKIIL